jgi:hypothetical protein
MSESKWITLCGFLSLALLFAVLAIGAGYTFGMMRGKNRVRMNACVWQCDASAWDVEPAEYIECLEGCAAWRCE